jgi:hypothetical protein
MTQETNDKNKIIDSKFIPLSQAAKRSGYTPEHLNLSARKGKLQAQKIGRNWYTTEEDLSAFLGLAMERKNEEKKKLSLRMDDDDVLESQLYAEEAEDEKNETEKIIEKISDLPSCSGQGIVKKILPRNWFQALAGVSAIIIIFPIVFFSVYSVKFYAAQKNNETKKIAMVNEAPKDLIINENENNIFSENSGGQVLGIVQGENTTADIEAEKKSGVVLASENFKAQNVSMGTGIVLASAEENAPLEISNIKSESFITGKKNNANSQEEVKLVVSWKTNKLAMSELDFSKNNGQDPKVLKEQSFGFNHAVVLTQIDPRTSYVYQVKGQDHWGAESVSDFYGIFTASKPVSIFDLISDQINQIFGWAIKK